MLAIKRKDIEVWTLPGGIVRDGQDAFMTLRSALLREAGGECGSERAHEVELIVEDLLDEHARPVYRGYVDDPRNTDNAWLETQAFHLHLEDTGTGRIGQLPLQGLWTTGEKAVRALSVAWLTVDASVEPRFERMLGAHRQCLQRESNSQPLIPRAQPVLNTEFVSSHLAARWVEQAKAGWAASHAEWDRRGHDGKGGGAKAACAPPYDGSIKHGTVFASRLEVKKEAVPWGSPYPGGYEPPDFNARERSGRVEFADGAIDRIMSGAQDESCREVEPAEAAARAALRSEVRRRSTFEGVPPGEKVKLGDSMLFEGERPINPRGRTGVRGRGQLGKWGFLSYPNLLILLLLLLVVPLHP